MFFEEVKKEENILFVKVYCDYFVILKDLIFFCRLEDFFNESSIGIERNSNSMLSSNGLYLKFIYV